jgi:ankyrin repeat protein
MDRNDVAVRRTPIQASVSFRTLSVLLILPFGVFLMARNDELVASVIGQPTGNNRLILAAMDGDSKTVERCLADGADPNTVDVTGYSAVTWAARSGNDATVEVLLRAGADPRSMTQTGLTPLAVAAGSGCTSTMRVLLSHGADPNYYNRRAGSPLFHSILHDEEAAAALLLHHGADPNLPCCYDGTTPLQQAHSQPNGERLVAMLLAAGAIDQTAAHNDAAASLKIVSSSPEVAAEGGS